ncbi:MAG TPA: beta-propeller domain-containing protein, partial [Streptosporangiaceae bacterium]
TVVGSVGDLGMGEQIYAVRFAGPVGYVVTYRAVDPLYTLDLSDPARPRLAGALLLHGYSAYLYPVDATHLIGIGQATDARGHILGTQISLFDVSDIGAPVRLAVCRLALARSEAEVDPHALLYWPATRLLVLPVQLPAAVAAKHPLAPLPMPAGESAQIPAVSAAVALRIGDHTITRLGTITNPAAPGYPPGVPGYPSGSPIRRSLVIGSTLWTLSDTGLRASDLTTFAALGWVPFE